MPFVKWSAIAVLLLATLLVGAGRLGLLEGSPPLDLGVREGKLKRPSATPNSVSSQADSWPDHPQRESARIAPLALRGDGPATIARLKALVQSDPYARIVDSRADYLYVQYTSRLLKFVDDLEFWFDPAQSVIQVRSSSRLGQSDFGVNRRRVEALREQLAAS